MKKPNIYITSILLGLILTLGSFPAVYAQEEEAAKEEFTLEEITVTAEKREVDVQKAPMVVTAISGNDIATRAITDLKESLLNLAGVAMMESPRGGQVFIRGIGTAMDLNQSDPSIAINRDNVYLGGSEASFSTMYDIDRVEVIRGPQGTMYGRNAAGGQVNVITKKPTDEFEASAGLSIGQYNLMSYNAVVNVPMADTLALRVAMDRQDRDGYFSDGSMNAKRFAMRTKVSYKPSNNLSFLLSYEYMDDKSSGANTVPVPGSAGKLDLMGPPAGTPGVTMADYGWKVPDANGDGIADDNISPEPEDGGAGGPPPPGPPGGGAPAGFINEPNGIPDIVDTGWEIPLGGDEWTNDIYHPAPLNDNQYHLVSLEATLDMGWSKLTLIPTLNKNTRNLMSELIMGISTGGGLMSQPYTQTQWSGEARLSSSEDSRFTWVVGGYYWKNDNKAANYVEAQDPLEIAQEQYEDPTSFAYQKPNQWMTATWRKPQDAMSWYGQITYPFTDRFRITAGLRDNNDNRDVDYRIVCWDLQLTDHPYYADTVLTDDGRHLYDSGRVAYSDPNKNLSIKGGLEYDFGPDSMIYAYYQNGYKAGGINLGAGVPPTTFDPELLDSYYLGTKNRFFDNTLVLNAEAYYYLYDGLQTSVFAEAFDIIQQRTTRISAMLNAEEGTNMGIDIDIDWLVTSKDRLISSISFMKTEYGELVLPAGNVGGSEDYELTGSDLPFAPTWSGTFTYEHLFNIANGGQFTSRIQTKISDGYYVTQEKYLAGSWQDRYITLDLYLTYNSPGGNYTASIWGKNVTKQVINTWAMPFYRRVIGAPRTTGITFNIRF